MKNLYQVYNSMSAFKVQVFRRISAPTLNNGKNAWLIFKHKSYKPSTAFVVPTRSPRSPLSPYRLTSSTFVNISFTTHINILYVLFYASENVVHLQSVMIKELGETVKVLSQDIDVLKRKLENLAEKEREGQFTNAVYPRSAAYEQNT